MLHRGEELFLHINYVNNIFLSFWSGHNIIPEVY